MRFHLNGQTIRFYPLTESQNCVRIEYRILSLIAPNLLGEGRELLYTPSSSLVECITYSRL